MLVRNANVIYFEDFPLPTMNTAHVLRSADPLIFYHWFFDAGCPSGLQ